MFTRIAVVNRGEAARRLIHAVREINSETVASETDMRATHGPLPLLQDLPGLRRGESQAAPVRAHLPRGWPAPAPQGTGCLTSEKITKAH